MKRRSSLPAVSVAHSRSAADRLFGGAWLALLLASAALVLSPFPGDGPNLRFAGWLGGYAASVAGQLYGLIKVAMPWGVAGLLFALAWPVARIRRWVIVAAPACLLAGWLVLPDVGWSEIREIVFAVPGLALGLWLAERAGYAVAEPAPAATPQPETGWIARDEAAATTQAERPAMPPLARPSWAARAASALLVAGAVLSLADFPFGRLSLGLALAAYFALLWWRPAAWLIVVPAALPLLDLAHWSGRFFWDEFDLLMLVTLAGALWHNSLRASAWQVPTLRGLLVALGVAGAVSLALGLFPLQAWDLNALSAYWSHYNSLRLAKGWLWGLLLFALYRSLDDKEAAFLRLAAGMALGVLGVSIWALREQWLFAGAATTLDYRVTASFSSMHTGGGHFEAYLVMALPFVWGGLFLSRQVLVRAAYAAVFLVGAYALFSTVARGGAIALAVALAILIGGTWRSRTRHPRRRTSLVAPVALGFVTVAVMLAGISGGFWQQRIAQTMDDAGIRWQHWSELLGMRDSGLATALFGQGLGTLPATTLASRLPAEAGSYRYVNEGGNAYLALNSAGTLYLAQRVPARPGDTLTLELAARAPTRDAGLEVSLCERNLFNSRQCQWLKFDVKPGSEGWHTFQKNVYSGEVGAGNWLTRRPVQLSLYNPVAGTVVEVDGVRLLDSRGENLVRNGDFSQGGDFWLFKSGDHLFWHAKNLWVHLLFEQGWLGVGLFSLLMLLAAVRLARAALQGAIEASAWLASMAALATVGVVESFFDAPRLTLLACLVVGVGAAWGKALNAHGGRTRRRRRRAPRQGDAVAPVV